MPKQMTPMYDALTVSSAACTDLNARLHDVEVKKMATSRKQKSDDDTTAFGDNAMTTLE